MVKWKIEAKNKRNGDVVDVKIIDALTIKQAKFLYKKHFDIMNDYIIVDVNVVEETGDKK